MPKLRLVRDAGSIHSVDQADDLFADEFNQASHGLSQWDVIYRSGLSTCAKAQANSESTSKMVSLCAHVEDVNNFSSLSTPGWQINETHGLGGSLGDDIYLSPSVAGSKTLTKPTSSGQFVVYLGWIIDANTWLWYPSRVIYPAEQE